MNQKAEISRLEILAVGKACYARLYSYSRLKKMIALEKNGSTKVNENGVKFVKHCLLLCYNFIVEIPTVWEKVLESVEYALGGMAFQMRKGRILCVISSMHVTIQSLNSIR